MSLIRNDWEKHTILTGPDAPCILGIEFLREEYFKDPKGNKWAFGVAAVETRGRDSCLLDPTFQMTLLCGPV